MNAQFPELRVGARAGYYGLSVFPLFGDGRSTVDYVLSDTALAAGEVTVKEISEAGTVPELLVENRGEHRILFLEGEELVGAKQNRIANVTILVSPKTTLTIPVSCVEAGRWRAVGREFQPADRACHAAGRRAKVAQVTVSRQSRVADQGAIWAEIDAKSARLGAQSRTHPAAAMLKARRTSLEYFVRALEPVDHQVGAVFAIGGAIAGLDVFDSPRSWRLLLPKAEGRPIWH